MAGAIPSLSPRANAIAVSTKELHSKALDHQFEWAGQLFLTSVISREGAVRPSDRGAIHHHFHDMVHGCLSPCRRPNCVFPPASICRFDNVFLCLFAKGARQVNQKEAKKCPY